MYAYFYETCRKAVDKHLCWHYFSVPVTVSTAMTLWGLRSLVHEYLLYLLWYNVNSTNLISSMNFLIMALSHVLFVYCVCDSLLSRSWEQHTWDWMLQSISKRCWSLQNFPTFLSTHQTFLISGNPRVVRPSRESAVGVREGMKTALSISSSISRDIWVPVCVCVNSIIYYYQYYIS